MPLAAPRRPLATRALAVLLAMSLGTAASAAPAPDPALQAATEKYKEGLGEREAGNFVAAADAFTQAYQDLPMSSREIRASVLFDLIDARRNAFAEGEGPGQICECERLLVGWLDEVKQSFGAKAEKLPDTRKARKLLVEVRKQIATLRGETPALDCADTPLERPPEPEPEPPPEPEPVVEPPKGPDPEQFRAEAAAKKRSRTLTIAGAVTTGVGGLFLGLMAGGLVLGRKAERDGEARTGAALAAGAPLSQNDPELRSIVSRGKLGNGLAIAGGVLATVAVATGVSLLVLGLRGKPSRAALAPALAPGYAGAGLVVRF